MTNTFSPEVIEALANARQAISRMGKPTVVNDFDRYAEQGLRLLQAVNTLDNAGVFAALDEQTGYTAAEDILAEAASRSLDEAAGGPLDPAEWGDLSRTDIARRSANGPLG
jgi:hypothetical protein